jgi:hypothetical protein
MQSRELSIGLFLKADRVQYTVCVGANDQLKEGGGIQMGQSKHVCNSTTYIFSLPYSRVEWIAYMQKHLRAGVQTWQGGCGHTGVLCHSS